MKSLTIFSLFTVGLAVFSSTNAFAPTTPKYLAFVPTATVLQLHPDQASDLEACALDLTKAYMEECRNASDFNHSSDTAVSQSLQQTHSGAVVGWVSTQATRFEAFDLRITYQHEPPWYIYHSITE